MADYMQLGERIAELVPERVPEGKKAEFARGFALYCDREDKETFALLSGSEAFTEAERALLQEKIGAFESFIRKRKGLDS